MVLPELPPTPSSCRSEVEEHRPRPAAIVRAVQQQRKPAQVQALRHGPSWQTVKMRVIDIHNHFVPRAWPDFAARYGTPNWPSIKHTESGKAEIMVGDRFFRHIYSACWDPEVRLQEMDR